MLKFLLSEGEAVHLSKEMGLHPLEFSECYLDSPSFREKIKAHEAELDKTNRFIKELYKDGKNLINATKRKSARTHECFLVSLAAFERSRIMSRGARLFP